MDKTTLDGAQEPASDPRLLFDIPGGGVSLGQLAQAVRQSLMPTGALVPFGGPTAPLGYLLCDGAAISRQTYAALFAVLGTAYGVGNGSTTFNVPDLRGRVPVGKNAATFTPLGSTGGEETHVLLSAELAAHTHTGPDHNHAGPSHVHTQDPHNHAVTDPGHIHAVAVGTGSGALQRITWASTFSGVTSASPFDGTGTNSGATNHTTGLTTNNTTPTNQAAGTGATGNAGTGATGSTGSGTAHNNLQPYQTVNYIIKI